MTVKYDLPPSGYTKIDIFENNFLSPLEFYSNVFTQFKKIQFNYQTTQARRQKKLRQPRLADVVIKVTKGLQERTRLIEWEDGETCK